MGSLRIILLSTFVLAFALGFKPALPQSVPTLSIAASVPSDGFFKLRWLDGKWRGTGVNGTEQREFYERYRVVDDSTLVFGSYADSTFSRITGTGRYEIRGGRLSNVGQGPRWIAVRVDADGVVFAPLERAENWLTWKRQNDNQWLAILEWKTADGTTQRRDYLMTRVR